MPMKSLHVSYLEPNFGSQLEDVARKTKPKAILPQPIVFHVGGTDWYLRRIDRLVSMPDAMVITGAGTNDLGNVMNVGVKIELDLRHQKQEGDIIFTS